ncbi:MAG: hypothetical protein QM744_04200 [Mesorhizobium sp.]
MISRRHFLQNVPSAVAVVGTTITAPALAETQSEIEKLYAEWRAVRDRDCLGWRTEAEANANYAEYRRLQIAIVESGLVPTSARELAIQFIVDTDFTGSDWSTHWENIVFGLIGEPIDGVTS